MNKTQKTVAGTAGLAVLAETFIGGIGITMLGGAVGIPASLVVAAAGGAALLFTEEDDDTSDKCETFRLIKGNDIMSYFINHTQQTGVVYSGRIRWCAKDVIELHSLEAMREAYKMALTSGYKKYV